MLHNQYNGVLRVFESMRWLGSFVGDFWLKANYLIHLKDSIAFQHQSGAIYSTCSDCGMQYFGGTGSYIFERVSKHRMHTIKGMLEEGISLNMLGTLFMLSTGTPVKS